VEVQVLSRAFGQLAGGMKSRRSEAVDWPAGCTGSA
jgi:hypothetical protein